ncbi:hypothetical protein BB558_000546 [Smittium angustum]|uniref:RRM domain-containing protein n=1 Tax=Smittium angustum TaxID=133377 RepID=A0A2U1JDW8_SMIAN|nr:hypothetical protein BB558_000546 [Smittium angustum]
MSTELDKSLDEIIKEESNNKRNQSSRTGPNRRRGGSSRNQSSNKSPYSRNRPRNQPMAGGVVYPPMMMQNQAMMMQAVAAASGMGGTEQKGKIIISNLDYKVTESDLRELFQQVGHVRKAALNFDSRGKSKGNGEVVFSKSSDAYRAVEKYNGVTLDGRPMKIEVALTPSSGMPMQIPVPVPMIVPNTGRQGGMGRRGGRGRGAGGPNRRGPHGKDRTPASKEDLDSQMDDYMQIDPIAAPEDTK